MAETCGWRASLDATVGRARACHGTLLASLAVRAAIACLGVGPIRLLFLSSIAGGLATPLTLALLLPIARDRAATRGKRSGRALAAGRAVVAMVTAAAAAFLRQIPHG